MAVCARGSVRFFMRYLPFFHLLGGGGEVSGRFSGSGMDDHQLIFLYDLRENKVVSLMNCSWNNKVLTF